MKPIVIPSHALAAGALALGFTVAACIPAPDSTPPPEPVEAAPTPTPAPPPVTIQPTYDNWMDAPATPGDWYLETGSGGSVARFGEANSEAKFSMRCERAQGEIVLMRAGRASGTVPMRILAETAERTVDARPTGGELPYIATTLDARDPILDAMAFSKGRFAIAVQGLPTLYLPAWAEVTRVIEDCR